MPEQQEIVLRIYSNVTELVGLEQSDACRLFGRLETAFEPNQRGGISTNRQKSKLDLISQFFEIVTVPTCRVDEVERQLIEEGFTTRRENRLPKSEQREQVEQLEILQQFDNAILLNPVGRIVVNSRNQKICVVLLVCELFPTENVVVLAHTKAERDRLFVVLAQNKSGRATTSTEDVNGATARVLICCEPTFIKIDPGYFKVLILPNLLRSLGNRMRQAAMALRSHRIYAIEHAGSPLDADLTAKVEYLAGREIFDFAHANQCVCAVHLIGFPAGQQHRKHDPLERKRRSIWENGRRNQFIVELAHALKSVRPRSDIQLPEDLKSRPLRVAILVESAAHGRILQKLLPDWTLLAEGDFIGKRDHIASLEDAFSLDRKIVTQCWAHRLSYFPMQVLIRADGDDAIVSLRGFPPERSIYRTVLLIDIVDISPGQTLERRRILYQRTRMPITICAGVTS